LNGGLPLCDGRAKPSPGATPLANLAHVSTNSVKNAAEALGVPTRSAPVHAHSWLGVDQLTAGRSRIRESLLNVVTPIGDVCRPGAALSRNLPTATRPCRAHELDLAFASTHEAASGPPCVDLAVDELAPSAAL